MRKAGVHVKAIIMVDSSEWHGSSGYGKTCMSGWALVCGGAHAGRSCTRASIRRRGASRGRAEGDASKHVDSLLKALEYLLLAAGVDGARVAGVSAGGILLSVRAAVCPL